MREESRKRLEEQYNEVVVKAVKEFRESAKYSKDEKITEEMLKYKMYKVENIAMRKAIPSRVLKEAILKS